jgi:hypothetical protein
MKLTTLSCLLILKNYINIKLKLVVDAWFTDGAQCTPRHTECRNLKERKNLRNLEADGKN